MNEPKDCSGDDQKIKNPFPIPCAGARDYYGEFDCGYAHAGLIECDKCVVNGGPMDPRTGRRYRKEERTDD